MGSQGIAGQIEAEGGRVTFARFMELALTHPDEGYYSRSQFVLGRQGHFSTAPRLSPVFNRAVARLLSELVDSWRAARSSDGSCEFTGPELPVSLVELGGGEGDLARAILDAWEDTRPDLRGGTLYGIVEIGKGLRTRQREALAPALNKGWQVQWGRDIREAARATCPGVILGNEFWDALPVHLLDVRGPRPLEAWVEPICGTHREGNTEFREVWSEVSEQAESEFRSLFGTVDSEVLGPLSNDGFIEIRPVLRTLIDEVGAVMPVGSLLTIDYGEWKKGPLDRDGFEKPPCARDTVGGDLHGRTLRGYFRHQLVDDPYVRVGSQDLTADVDFRALDLHGREAGFETVLFTTVAALLRADGGEDRLSELLQRANTPTGEALEADREARVLEALLDPEGLGGNFKVMLQVRE